MRSWQNGKAGNDIVIFIEIEAELTIDFNQPQADLTKMFCARMPQLH